MSAPQLSDVEDDLMPRDRNNGNNSDAHGYASDEAIEDTNFRDDDEAEESKKRRIDPTAAPKRVNRNPQPKLDAERLKGPKGIHVVEKHFMDFKFRGKGNEKNDLNQLMKRLEYWSHRLFPKLEFDDFLTKLETLGTKKPVQTHLTKIRLGMLVDDDVVLNDAADEDDEKFEDSAPIDEFDALISEALKRPQNSVTPQRHNFSSHSIGSNQASTRYAAVLPGVVPESPQVEITAEMKEKMERNRQMAIQKRLARIEAEEVRKKAEQQGDKNELVVGQEKDKPTGLTVVPPEISDE